MEQDGLTCPRDFAVVFQLNMFKKYINAFVLVWFVITGYEYSLTAPKNIKYIFLKWITYSCYASSSSSSQSKLYNRLRLSGSKLNFKQIDSSQTIPATTDSRFLHTSLSQPNGLGNTLSLCSAMQSLTNHRFLGTYLHIERPTSGMNHLHLKYVDCSRSGPILRTPHLPDSPSYCAENVFKFKLIHELRKML